MIKKAFVLAAGLGERLKPLTDKTPKPMLPVGNRPMIDYCLYFLKNEGIEEVVINLHHLGEKIKRHVGTGERYGLRVHFSEEKEILGTGGGLKKAASHFTHEKHFLLINSIILIQISLKDVFEQHQKEKNAATLVVKKRGLKSLFTSVSVQNNKILGFERLDGNYFYTGLLIATPKLLEQLPDGKSCLIRQGIIPLMEKGESIGAYLYEGPWNKIETAESYQQIQEAWAASHNKRI